MTISNLSSNSDYRSYVEGASAKITGDHMRTLWRCTVEKDNLSVSDISEIKDFFKSHWSHLVGELMEHPEQAKYYRIIAAKLRKANKEDFCEIQTLVGSIRTIALTLKKDEGESQDESEKKIEKLKKLTKIFADSHSKNQNIFLPPVIRDFHRSESTVEEVLSIPDSQVRDSLAMRISQRDQLSASLGETFGVESEEDPQENRSVAGRLQNRSVYGRAWNAAVDIFNFVDRRDLLNKKLPIQSEIPVVGFSELEEDSLSYSKINGLIISIKNIVSSINRDGIDFSTYQRLKKTKQEAADLFAQKNLSFIEKIALKQVMLQYDEITGAVELLSILEKIDQEVHSSPEVPRETIRRFMYLWGRQANFVGDAQDIFINGESQNLWEHKREHVEVNFWRKALVYYSVERKEGLIPYLEMESEILKNLDLSVEDQTILSSIVSKAGSAMTRMKKNPSHAPDALAERLQPKAPYQVVPIIASDDISPEVYPKVKELVQIINQIATDLGNEGIDFEAAEQLRQVKKEAKQLLSNEKISEATRLILRQVIQQCNYIVQSVEVLSFLKQIKKDIVSPIERDDSGVFKPYSRRTAEKFARVLGFQFVPSRGDYGADREAMPKKLRLHFHEMRERLLNPKLREELWTLVRKNMWRGAVAAKSTVLNRNRLTFITGSKSSSIPFILKIERLAPTLNLQPALVPTGQLFKHGVVPIAGELGKGVNFKEGPNVRCLSGTGISGLTTCVEYATRKDFQFNEKSVLASIWSDFREGKKGPLDVSALSLKINQLLQMGWGRGSYPRIKRELQKQIQTLQQSYLQEPGLTAPIAVECAPYWPLVGTRFSKGGEIPQGAVRRGQVVGVCLPVGDQYCVVESCKKILSRQTRKPDYEYRMIGNKEGMHFFDIEITHGMIRVVPDEVLQAELQGTHPFTAVDQDWFMKQLRNDMEKLQDLIQQLDQPAAPMQWDAQELRQIQYPFPIIWGSVSSSLPLLDDLDGTLHDEILLEGNAVLGKDIQVVFTPKEHVAELQMLLQGKDVEVLPFEAAFYLQGTHGIEALEEKDKT